MIFRTLARSFLCARFISALKSRCLGWPFACHENTAEIVFESAFMR
jgi:hypothetical protein